MNKDNKKKIITLIISIIIILSVYLIASFFFQWFPFNIKKIDIYPSPPQNLSQEDYDYIKNITENLSNVIFRPDCSKGREFGTEGEHYAALNILVPCMSKLGLYNPGFDEIPYIEKIQNLDYPYKERFYNNLNLTDKLDVLAIGLRVSNIESNNVEDIECFIAPTWNNTGKYDDRGVLTRNFSLTNVKLIIQKEFDFDDFLDYAFRECINWPINDSIENFTKKLLEDYYNFSIDKINPDDPLTWPPFIDLIEIHNKKLVIFEVNNGFNPHYNNPIKNNRLLHPIGH